MMTVSFSEAAALTYIAKRKDLTAVERDKLTKGLTRRGKKIAQVLTERKTVGAVARARVAEGR